MNISQIYIVISIVLLLVITIVLFFVKRHRKEKLTALASLAFAFILAGLIFGYNEIIGYILMGIGVLFALVDIFKKSKSK